jgi:hypothetical protein
MNVYFSFVICFSGIFAAAPAKLACLQLSGMLIVIADLYMQNTPMISVLKKAATSVPLQHVLGCKRSATLGFSRVVLT